MNRGLDPDRIVDAAAAVADARGLRGVSMRNVATELGVEAMSLYHHVNGKEDLLDRLADWVFQHVDLPATDAAWRPAMASRARSMREVLAQHPWALGLVESRRAPGAALLRHHDRILGCLRSNGFSVRQAAHTFSVIDAYVYGFVLTELNLPFDTSAGAEDLVAEMTIAADEHPHLAELTAELITGGSYTYGDEFEHGLELILTGVAAELQ